MYVLIIGKAASSRTWTTIYAIGQTAVRTKPEQRKALLIRYLQQQQALRRSSRSQEGDSHLLPKPWLSTSFISSFCNHACRGALSARRLVRSSINTAGKRRRVRTLLLGQATSRWLMLSISSSLTLMVCSDLVLIPPIQTKVPQKTTRLRMPRP